MRSRLILLLPGCFRVQEHEDEPMRLQPIRLRMVVRVLGLPEFFFTDVELDPVVDLGDATFVRNLILP